MVESSRRGVTVWHYGGHIHQQSRARGIAHRFLRTNWKEANLPQAFQILDSDDQLRLVKRTLRALELDEAHYPPKQVQWFINGHKDEGRRPQHVDDQQDATTAQ